MIVARGVIALVATCTAAPAIASPGGARVTGGIGAGAVVFVGHDTHEPVIPVHLRVQDDAFAFELGRDGLVGDGVIGTLAFGVYRVGGLWYPRRVGRIDPYLYARVGYLLAGAHTDEPAVWNIGVHHAAGAGAEWSAGRLGLYLELGELGDLAGTFVAASVTAGVLVRLDR